MRQFAQRIEDCKFAYVVEFIQNYRRNHNYTTSARAIILSNLDKNDILTQLDEVSKDSRKAYDMLNANVALVIFVSKDKQVAHYCNTNNLRKDNRAFNVFRNIEHVSTHKVIHLSEDYEVDYVAISKKDYKVATVAAFRKLLLVSKDAQLKDVSRYVKYLQSFYHDEVSDVDIHAEQMKVRQLCKAE